jgi:NAD+ synthase
MEIPEGALEVLDVFIREFTGKRDVVIGISGGIDSTLVSFLVKRNINKNKIHLYYISFGKKSTDIERVTDFLGMDYEEINLDPALNAFEKYEGDRMVLGNVKARLRMVFLYMKANKYGGLVAGTSNKSELLTGYFTKFGDGGSDFQPIGDLYKTQVYALAKKLDFPEWLISKKPSAELWEGQTDEEELGITYAKLDRILECIEYLKTPEECEVEGCSHKDIERIYSLVRDNAHKRVNFYIPKIGYRSVGTDWLE